jgi:hypothetical protein
VPPRRRAHADGAGEETQHSPGWNAGPRAQHNARTAIAVLEDHGRVVRPAASKGGEGLPDGVVQCDDGSQQCTSLRGEGEREAPRRGHPNRTAGGAARATQSQVERLVRPVQQRGAVELDVAARGQVLSVAALHPQKGLRNPGLDRSREAAAAGRDAREA